MAAGARLQLAKKFGAKLLLDPRDPKFAEKLGKCAGKQGLDAVNRAIDLGSQGTLISDDPELEMHSGAELKAELADDPAAAARLYRAAGDKYLNDRQDYRNAARCYRLFLARAGDTGLSPDPADTWLLTSLKNTAFKEKYDAAARDD